MKYVNPTSDLAFKKVLGSNENIHILAAFIKDFFFIEPKELVVENPYSIKSYKESIKDEETFKLRHTISDIAATMHFADFTSELQLRRGNFFDERSLYYPLNKFVSRYKVTPGDTSPYSRLRPIYALNIMGYNHFPGDNDALRVFQLYDPARSKGFPKNLINLGYFELPKSNIETPNQKHWQDYFLQNPLQSNAPDYISNAMEIIERANMKEEELDMLTKTEYLRSIYDDQLAFARDEGWEEGHEEGHIAGHKAGHIAGHMAAMKEFAQKLLKLNRPLTEIMETTGITLEELESLN